MATVRVWQGFRGFKGNWDVSRFVWIEFDGELIGSLTYEIDEDREDECSFYRLKDGRIVVAEHRYGDWNKNGFDYGVVSVYSSVEDAAKRGWFEHLVRIGAYDAPVLDLDEWLRQYEVDE